MDSKTNRIFFSEGDMVAHKENIQLKMEVRRIIRTKRKAKVDGELDRRFTLGIECGWWSGDDYIKEVFHTRALVPWEVAEGGFIDVQKWLMEQQNIKSS